MRDKDNGFMQFFLKIEKDVLHIGSDQWIKRRKGFVHQQDFRICCQRAGKADTLLHTT